MAEILNIYCNTVAFDSYMSCIYNNSGVLATYELVVVTGRLIAMAERDHEELAVAVEREVHAGIQLLDSSCQGRGLHCGERARPCIDLGTFVAASAALCQTSINRE
jgi:hypothetical protein